MKKLVTALAVLCSFSTQASVFDAHLITPQYVGYSFEFSQPIPIQNKPIQLDVQKLFERLRQNEVEDIAVMKSGGKLSPQAIHFAMEARKCALRSGVSKNSGNLTVIDYSLPTTEKRLFIVDPKTGEILTQEWVMHGSGSGKMYANTFSNIPESHQSSLGLIEPMFVFQSSFGRSLRLNGLEKGVNDKVFEREIIVHQSNWIGNGKFSNSQGCQAVRPEAIDVVINGTEGGLMYAYHKDYSPKLASKLLECDPESKNLVASLNVPEMSINQEFVQQYVYEYVVFNYPINSWFNPLAQIQSYSSRA